MATTTITTTEPLEQGNNIVLPVRRPSYYDTELNYRLDITEGGDNIIWGGTYALLKRKYKSAPVRIFDVRGRESDFALDTHGFTWVKHKSNQESAFGDMKTISREIYDKECTDLVYKLTGASHVHLISHLWRYKSWEEATKEVETENKPDMEMTPGNLSARYAHVDQSYEGAKRRLYTDLGIEEGNKRSKHRWAIFNIWRPIGPVNRDPLAVCDSRSVRDDELVDTMHLVPALWPRKPLENHMWAVNPPKSPEQHKWYFLSGMDSDDALVFKMFDSKKSDGNARRVVHSAFETPGDFGPTRKSVETRCFVFWDDQPAE